MKKTIAVLFAMAAAAVFAVGSDDFLVTFSTPGPDKYADGTEVLDNECYSLVYTVGDVQTRVLTVSAAKNGKCMPVLFVLTAAEAAQFKGGEWGVFLLDTRDFAKDATGKTLSELDSNGQPKVVNVTAAVAEGITADGIANASATSAVTAGSYDLAAVPTPKVTGIKIVGANVVVTVKDTVPYVGYTLQAGSDVKAFSVPDGAATASGNAAGEIMLVTPKAEGAQFFKVSTVK